jgi:hypothetical protein
MRNDAMIVLNTISKKKVLDTNFTPTQYNNNLQKLLNELRLSDENYIDISFLEYDKVIYISVIGKGKYEGFSACGSYFNITVVEGECKILEITKESCFEFNNGIISSYSKNKNCPSSIVIPDKINNIPVIGIGSSAFRDHDLINVTIPGSIKNIGNNAFENNRLENVTINNGVTNIGSHAFADNRITSVNIPSSVINIGDRAFSNNRIESVNISNGLKNIEDNAFSGNRIKSVKLPNSVTSIGQSAFADNQITSVYIGNGITNIGDSAFRYNNIIQGNLKIDRMPNTVTIGSNAFNNNGVNGSTTITPIYLR